ncbi:hypothetical protein FJTKL_08467 [Diaporthe vaccinii]|uniref:Nephrocystin 3-like N-terminal domain-containing protein n=1 Tax=Diaporthe vaccinii TaxID=105482 RepID=A0ABR4ER52_9PEZI
MPDLQGYASIFKEQPEVLEVLKRFYGDIIQFYHTAFCVLGRPGAFGIRDWRRIFDSVWKTFRTKFSPVLGSLRRHRELLVQVKLTATYGAVETTRRALQETIEKSNEELKQILNVIQQKKKQILDKLGNQGPDNDKGHRRLPDQRYPTSGDWILGEHNFLKWLDPDDLSNDLLYLNGMPGAGKTTLVSRIIDGMTKETTAQQRPLLNFYFEHGQSGKTLLMDMLRAFIEQLLQQDDAIVDDLHETVLPARSSDLSSVSWLADVATRLILAQKRSSNIVVKLLVSGQRDGVIDAMVQEGACTIRLDNQRPHLRDIENFSSSALTQIKDRFPGLEEEEEMLTKLHPSRIAEASKGMFIERLPPSTGKA